VDDNDLLFSVTLRSGKPDQDLLLKDNSSTYLAGFIQDDWRLSPRLTLNLGLRYELDTNVKNISGYGDINPIVQPFLEGERKRDANNFGPRIGLSWSSADGGLQIHGGYGIYYDRVTLEIDSLERGLDGRALPSAGRERVLHRPGHERRAAVRPTFSNPFTGFILPGPALPGSTSSTTQQTGRAAVRPGRATPRVVLRVDLVHNLGTHFIIGGPSVRSSTRWWAGRPRGEPRGRQQIRRGAGDLRSASRRDRPPGLPLARARCYSNDDQIRSERPHRRMIFPRSTGPPNEQRIASASRLVLPGRSGCRRSGRSLPASPMDILLPDASSRVPTLERNAGGRRFRAARAQAYLTGLNAGRDRGVLPLVSRTRFNDNSSISASRSFGLCARV
jgi:hypothetical protein